jgi:hypothetical protein
MVGYLKNTILQTKSPVTGPVLGVANSAVKLTRRIPRRPDKRQAWPIKV